MHISKIGILGRTYRHIQRYRQILTILFRHGFGELVDTLKIEQYLDIGLNMISRKHREKIETLSRAERVRTALEELGPTFVKMGQILSTRPDLLPADVLNELSKLQDHVPVFDIDEAKRIVREELKSPLDEVFEFFEEEPIASASIAQVHRARLSTGEDVVLKIQRPGIGKIIEVDLEIMLHLAMLMEKHLKGMEVHRPTRIVEEFARTLEKELNFSIEASHMEQFSVQFINDSSVYVPRVYNEYTTSKVLTMEYVHGIKSSNVDELEKAGFDRSEIARRGFDLIMKQVFIHGFFHADPHPGNIFILPNNVICYLDFGMMGRIGRQVRESFSDLLESIVRRDEVKAAEALIRLTTSEEESDIKVLEKDVADFIAGHFYSSLAELNLGRALQQLLEMAAKHHLTIPADIFFMIKALSTAEGLGRMLDPSFNAARQATPFMRRIHMERMHPKRIALEMYDAGKEFFRLIKDIPGEVREILKQARKGRVKIEFEHRGLEPMMSTLDRISNRLAFAIVLASLVVGSSLIILSNIPPKWHDIPVIGLIGFLIAFLMAVWLLWTIVRHGRM
jgi:ubiquinone biosynthesis protein